VLRVEPGVVVALERVAAALDSDDPVHDGRLQKVAAVGHHIPYLVAAGRPHDRQVTSVEPRLHADAVGGDAAGAPTEGCGTEQHPAECQPGGHRTDGQEPDALHAEPFLPHGPAGQRPAGP
jgi:hypothetical protein